MRKLALNLAAPIGAFVLTMVICSAALLAFGSNPFAAFSDMVSHAARLESQIDLLNRATPLFLSGVACAIGFRMNLFNIGVEGQYLLAALVAAHVGSLVVLPKPLHIGFIFVVAMVVGGAWAGLAGLLKVTRGVDIVISTIMLNFIARSGLIAWGVKSWQADVDLSTSSLGLGTTPIPDSGVLPNLNPVVELFTRDIAASRSLSSMLVVAIVVGFAYWFLLARTRFGFDLRASGINAFAAKAGGVPPKKMLVTAMILSGAVAGLVGLVEVMEIAKFRPNQIQGLGFAGIAVALLGRNHPVGIALASLLFAFLDTSSGVLQTTKTASREIIVIMQGVILLSSVIAYELTRRVRVREEARLTAEALKVQPVDGRSASIGSGAA